MNTTLPTIHLNGTHPQTLLDDNLVVRSAIQDVFTAMEKQEFNMRDYYQVEGSWQKALGERREIAAKLREFSDYFLAVAEHCSKQIEDRETRRMRS